MTGMYIEVMEGTMGNFIFIILSFLCVFYLFLTEHMD